MTKRVLLIDGDIVAYKAALSSETPLNWGDGYWTLHAFEEDVISKIVQYHWNLMETLEADRAVYALTDGDNWRKDVLPSYKENRADTRKPMLLPFAREYLLDNHETYLRPGLEGDDCLGILATHPKLFKGTGIIVSLDKDMRTIPGRYYNDQKPKGDKRGIAGVEEISEEEAHFWHMCQTLAGDPVDGYSGCPGIGMTGAVKLLSEPCIYEQVTETIKSGKNKGKERTTWKNVGPAETLWDAVVSQYLKAGLTEADALQQARVARVLQASDYDFKRKEPILWNPS